MTLWTITALDTGRSPLDKSTLTYLTDPGVPFQGAVAIFVLESPREKIVVDTSFESVDAIQRINNRTMSRTPEQEPSHCFEQIGLDPEAVGKVVLTHLHFDHTGRNDLFPNARFYVQRSELQYAFLPNPGGEWIYHSPLLGLKPRYLDSDLEPIEGDLRIAEGVTILHVPGHTPGAQAVLVDTKDGVYCVAGDAIPLFENVEKGIPHGVHDSVSEWFRSLGRIKALADYVIPSHDPRLFETDPIARWPGAYAHATGRP